MIESFYLNGILWRIATVSQESELLIDRTGRRTVATTDPNTYYIYLSEGLSGLFLAKVLIHELGHAVMISYGLIDDIRIAVKPEYRIDAEEWVCNFIAEYGMRIFSIAYHWLGDETWHYILYMYEKIMR